MKKIPTLNEYSGGPPESYYEPPENTKEDDIFNDVADDIESCMEDLIKIVKPILKQNKKKIDKDEDFMTDKKVEKKWKTFITKTVDVAEKKMKSKFTYNDYSVECLEELEKWLKEIVLEGEIDSINSSQDFSGFAKEIAQTYIENR